MGSGPSEPWRGSFSNITLTDLRSDLRVMKLLAKHQACAG
jgi:hypothetical protein